MTTIVTVTRTVRGSRTCSRCDHVWHYETKVGASEEAWMLNPKSDEAMLGEARRSSNWQAMDVHVHHNVVCPRCGHLCVKVRDRYFSKGFARAFEALFSVRACPLLWMIGVGALASVFAFMGILLNSTSNSEESLLPTAVAILIGCLLVVAGVFLGRYGAAWTNRSRDRALEFVKASSEDDIEQVVLQACTKHDGDLPHLNDSANENSSGGIDYWVGAMNRQAKARAAQRQAHCKSSPEHSS